MGPTWGPSGADRTQVGPMLAQWTLLSREVHCGTNALYTTYHVSCNMKLKSLSAVICIHSLLDTGMSMHWCYMRRMCWGYSINNQSGKYGLCHSEMEIQSFKINLKTKQASCNITMIWHTYIRPGLYMMIYDVCLFFILRCKSVLLQTMPKWRRVLRISGQVQVYLPSWLCGN